MNIKERLEALTQIINAPGLPIESKKELLKIKADIEKTLEQSNNNNRNLKIAVLIKEAFRYIWEIFIDPS